MVFTAPNFVLAIMIFSKCFDFVNWNCNEAYTALSSLKQTFYPDLCPSFDIKELPLKCINSFSLSKVHWHIHLKSCAGLFSALFLFMLLEVSSLTINLFHHLYNGTYSPV